MNSTALLQREAHRYKASRAPLFVLVVFVAVAAIAYRPRYRSPGFGESKVDITRMMAREYADSAYRMWRINNGDRLCPDGLRELNEYTSRKRIDEITDTWGYDFHMTCDASGIRVWSLGEDGVNHTADDIRSWD